MIFAFLIEVRIHMYIIIVSMCKSLFLGVTIGLEMSAVSVSENGGNVEARVRVMSGVLSNPVTVEFSTLSRTAIGKRLVFIYVP